MTAGDTLLVTQLDRLARSTRDFLNILDAVAKAGAGFRSLADVWADTTTPHGRLMLTVHGGLAEFERDLIQTRTGEGRARAKTRGVHMGRPPKLTKHQRREALAALADGTATQADLARRFNVSQATISRGDKSGRLRCLLCLCHLGPGSSSQAPATALPLDVEDLGAAQIGRSRDATANSAPAH